MAIADGVLTCRLYSDCFPVEETVLDGQEFRLYLEIIAR